MSTSSARVRLLAAAVAAVLSLLVAVTVTAVTGSAASAAPSVYTPRPRLVKSTSKPSTSTNTRPTATTSAPAVTSSAPQSTSTTSQPVAAGSTTPVLYGGQSYCPGYVIGVKNGAYGVGARIVLRGVTSVGVAGTTLTVEGGPSCLPGAICGAIDLGQDVVNPGEVLEVGTPPPAVRRPCCTPRAPPPGPAPADPTRHLRQGRRVGAGARPGPRPECPEPCGTASAA